ncbi:MAG: hypothetical protein WCP36_00905 [Methanomicrobiales archaeon]
MADIGWKAYPNAKINDPVNTLPTVDDAWMGAAANCSCIAGMASIAWVYPQSINQNLLADYSAKFYSPAPTTQPIPQTANLYQDGNGALKYAKSRTSTEFWPSFYEKAFKKLLTGVYGKDTEPDMTGDWHNISAYAMSRMTGWADSTNLAIPGTAANIWTALKNICAPLESPGGANTLSAQTKYPALAFTKSSGAGLTATNEPYTSHSYSILGIYQDAAGSQYVILRDPKASDVTWNTLPSPKKYPKLTTSPWVVKYANYEQKNPRLPLAGTLATVNMALNNWIFGLKIASADANESPYTFPNLFSSYAYIS